MRILRDECFVEYIYDQGGEDIIGSVCRLCGFDDMGASLMETIDTHINQVHGIELSIVGEDELIYWPQRRRVLR